MPTAKNLFQILNLVLKRHIFKEKKYIFYVSKLEKFPGFKRVKVSLCYIFSKKEESKIYGYLSKR